jgi:hypothetical protein
MAITFEANYSKKLGLPGYSSHQYSVTFTTELTDIKQVELESARLYALLQSCVDRDIQETGYLPQSESIPISNRNYNGNNGNGHSQGSNGNGNGANGNHSETWNCSEKQKSLILKIIQDNRLDKKEIEDLAQDRFSKGVKALNKLEASCIIEILLENHSKKGNHYARR